MEVNKDRVEDVRDAMWELEKDGEIVVHKISDENEPRMAKTIYGWDKRSRPTSCGITSHAANAATSRVIRPPCCG